MNSLGERASSPGHEARTAVEMVYSGNGGMLFSGGTYKCWLPVYPRKSYTSLLILLISWYTLPHVLICHSHVQQRTLTVTSWFHSTQKCNGPPHLWDLPALQLKHQPSPVVLTTTGSIALPCCKCCSFLFTPTNKHHTDINDKCVEGKEIRQ